MIERRMALAVLLVAGLASTGDAVPFSSSTVDASMNGDVKAMADFDGDGQLDLVVGGSAMYWYRAPAWTRHTVASAAVEFTTDMQAADMDGDGDPDIIVPDGSGVNNVGWFENPLPATNPTNTSAWARHAIGTHGNWAHDVEVGDINADGRPDLVTRGGPLMMWLRQSPTNWLSRDVGSAVGLTSGEGLALGDIDGDGDLDIVAAGRWIEMPADPMNGPLISHSIATPPHAETAHLAVDLNGDGRPDVVMCPLHSAGDFAWYEAPADPATGAWTRHPIHSAAGSHKISAADLDNDGSLDLALGLEGTEVTVWLSSGGASPTFTRQLVSGAPGAHNLRVGDAGGDHDVDLFGSGYIGQTPPVTLWENTLTSPSNIPPMVVLRQPVSPVTVLPGARVRLVAGATDGNGPVTNLEFRANGALLAHDALPPYTALWTPATAGVFSITAVALDNAGAAATSAAVTVTVQDRTLSLDSWQYVQADNSRERAWFGLAFGDVTGDGFSEVVSGRYLYINPGGRMTGAWSRVALSASATLDANLMLDVDDDNRPDIIAQDLPNVYWLKPASALAQTWSAVPIGTLPVTEHQNSQGYRTARIVPGGNPEIVYTAGYIGGGTPGLYYFVIPPDPSTGSWPRVQITTDSVSEDGLAAGDIDNDGDDDVVAAYSAGGDQVAWWENPGTGAGNWTRHDLGDTAGAWCDRLNLADVNGDGRPDVLASVENGAASGAATYWFECPLVPTNAAWTRRTIATQGSTNSKDVGDVDRDGDVDAVTGEHKGTLQVVIWENLTHATAWTGHTVSAGRESHLGARLHDLDGDGDLDIISIAYDAPQHLHIWRNDAVDPFAAPPGAAELAVSPSSISCVATVSNSPLARAFEIWNAGTGTVNYAVSEDIEWLSVSATSGSSTGEYNTIQVSFQAASLPIGGYSGDITIAATNPGILNPTQYVHVSMQVVSPGATLVAWWALDETSGSSAADSSGNGHTGRVEEAAWTPGYLGGGLRFDGTDDRIELGPLDVGGTGLTLTAWINADSLAGDIRFISKATGTQEADHYWMLGSYDAGDVLRFRLKAGGSTTTLVADSGTLTPGVWTHVAAVYDGTALRLYLDGSPVGSTPKTGEIDTNNSVQAWIGANPPDNGSGPFDGIMDDVRIYHVALTQAEIQDLMIDSDADSLPDAWELTYFPSLADASPSSDADHDRFIDLHEYLAGTDPTNNASLLMIDAFLETPTGIVLRWLSVSNHRYRVDLSTNLIADPFVTVASNRLAITPRTEYVDPPQTGSPARFYRITLE